MNLSHLERKAAQEARNKADELRDWLVAIEYSHEMQKARECVDEARQWIDKHIGVKNDD